MSGLRGGTVRGGTVRGGVLRIGRGVSIRVRPAPLVVAAALVVVILAVAWLTLTLGALGIAPGDLLPSILGIGTARDALVFSAFRGPRLAVAIAVGAAYGISGTLFQTVTRNPLGSPDVIGLTSGAAAGAAAFGLLVPGILPTPVGALLGALAAMALVWLGTGRGFSSPARMLLVGIGVSAMALAFVQFVIARSSLQQATVLAAWVNGSLAARSWSDAAIIGVSVVVLAPLALLLSGRLQLMEMGDEQADALGARSSATRLAAILVAIGLATAAVSVAGPIAFVALTAPQIARRVVRRPGPQVVLSALMGAFLLSLADLVTQQSPFGVQLPVGIVTAAIGGVYLGYLLVAEWKRGTV